MTIAAMCISWALAAVFFSSSLPKLRRPKGFVMAVVEYRILPTHVSFLYGWFLPPLEFFCALLAFTGLGLRFVMLIMSLLFCSFILAMSMNMARGRNLECSCFGVGIKRKIGWTSLLQNIGLLGLALTNFFLPATWTALEPWSVFHLSHLVSSTILLPYTLCVLIATGVVVLLRKPYLVERG